MKGLTHCRALALPIMLMLNPLLVPCARAADLAGPGEPAALAASASASAPVAVAASAAASVPQPAASRPSTADIPFKKEGGGFWGESLSSLFTSLGLLALMSVALYVLRDVLRKKMPQTFQAKAGGGLRVKERLRINPKAELYVIQYDGRELLIGHSGETLVKITESGGAAEPSQAVTA